MLHRKKIKKCFLSYIELKRKTGTTLKKSQKISKVEKELAKKYKADYDALQSEYDTERFIMVKKFTRGLGMQLKLEFILMSTKNKM